MKEKSINFRPTEEDMELMKKGVSLLKKKNMGFEVNRSSFVRYAIRIAIKELENGS